MDIDLSVAPITGLHDAWTYILPLLRFQDISRLLATGNGTLVSALVPHLKRFEFEWTNGYLDLTRCLSAASRLPYLVNLKILASEPDILAQWPFDATLFPKSLESLSLRFSNCITAVLGHIDLATALPNLTSLSFSGASSAEFSMPSNPAYPPNLTSLSLDASNLKPLLWSQRDVQNLPKSLLTLELMSIKPTEPNFERDDFPPALTSLVLSTSFTSPCFVDSLPRTLRKLQIQGSLQSTLVSASSHFAFPWRSYFPHLTDLTLPMGSQLDANGLTHLLDPSVVLSEPRFSALKDTISADSSLSLARETRYTALTFAMHEEIMAAPPAGDANASEDDGRTYVESLLPQLSSLEKLACPSVPARVLHFFGYPHLKNLQTLTYGIMSLDSIPSGIEHYPFLSTLICSRINLAAIPPTLRSLNCSTIAYDELVPAPLYFPARSLDTLVVRIGAIKLALVESLPESITKLVIGLSNGFLFDRTMKPDLSPCMAPEGADTSGEIDPAWLRGCDKSWTSIATKLVKLKSFTIHGIGGCPTTKLTPIASCVLEEFCVVDTGGFETHIEPWAMAILDDLNTAGRAPVFPPSLRSMFLSFFTSPKLPFSVLATLPRSLTSFTASNLHPKLPPLSNSPFPELTPEEVLRALPPNLKRLKAGLIMYPVQPLVLNAQSLSSLPKSLQSFHIDPTTASFVLEDDPTRADPKDLAQAIALLLPPNLSSFAIAAEPMQSLCLEAYLQQSGRNVYHTPNPAAPAAPTAQ